MSRIRAGSTMTLTGEQWDQLTARMRGEDTGNWILSSHWRALHAGVGNTGCVAITIPDDDVSTLIIFLTHLIQVTVEPFSDDWEDLRYLADQLKAYRSAEYTIHPTYYLPCVQVAGDAHRC